MYKYSCITASNLTKHTSSIICNSMANEFIYNPLLNKRNWKFSSTIINSEKLLRTLSSLSFSFSNLQKKYFDSYDGDPYHIETSPLICSENQWTVFYVIWTSVMKGSSLVDQWISYIFVYLLSFSWLNIKAERNKLNKFKFSRVLWSVNFLKTKNLKSLRVVAGVEHLSKLHKKGNSNKKVKWVFWNKIT